MDQPATAESDRVATFGMWAFLASELLLFGGLFALYAAYRTLYPIDFAVAARHNDLALGTINTVVLITSSFTVALAVHAARSGWTGWPARLLGLTIALGAVFLVLKGIEYRGHFQHGIYPGGHLALPCAEGEGAGRGACRNAELDRYGVVVFFTVYFFTTALHALHVIIGLGVLAYLVVRARRGAYTPARHVGLELGALYWHLVDIIWIFLWPLLYLSRAR